MHILTKHLKDNWLSIFFAFLLSFSVLMRFSWDFEIQTITHICVFTAFSVLLFFYRTSFDIKQEGPLFVLPLLVLLSFFGNNEKAEIRTQLLILCDAVMLSYLWGYVPREQRKMIFSMLVYIAALFSLITIVRSLINPSVSIIFYPISKSIVINANIVATFLAFCLFLALPNFSKGWLEKTVFFLILAGLIVTRSRNAILVTIFIYMTYNIFYSGRGFSRKIKINLVYLISALLVIAFLTLIKYISDKNFEGFFLANRLMWWMTAFEMFKHNAFNGIGWGNFGNYFAAYKASAGLYSLYAHNIFLQFAAESGIPGLLGFILLLISGFFSFRSKINHKYDDIPYFTSVFLAVFSLLLVNMLDFSFFVPFILFLFMIGLRTAIEYPLIQEKQPTSKRISTLLILPVCYFLVLTPFLAWSFQNKGVEYSKIGDYTSAQNLLLVSTDMDPLPSIYFSRLAENSFALYRTRKDPEFLQKAVYYQKEALKRFPENHLYLSDLAWLYWSAGEKENAILAMNSAVNFDKFNKKYPDTVNYFTSSK
ncbi:MAG: O-antigen ligase family protein [Elusimicrobiota bacterium]